MNGQNSGQTGPEMMDEPGSEDNRLTLSPGDDRWKSIQDWEDGKEYVFKEVRVRQISAGEFEVTQATPADAAAPDDEGAEAAPDSEAGAGEDNPPQAGSGYPNPAIENLMMGEKR